MRTTHIPFLPPLLDECALLRVGFGTSWCPRNSARKVPLNDSQKALPVGLPGLENSIFT